MIFILFSSAKPGQPGAPQCVARNRERIELKWNPPKSDGGNPIKGYTVERREKAAKKKDWTPINHGDLNKVRYCFCF
jgi:hypothetical protein